jgi:hypothetical protein
MSKCPRHCGSQQLARRAWYLGHLSSVSLLKGQHGAPPGLSLTRANLSLLRVNMVQHAYEFFLRDIHVFQAEQNISVFCSAVISCKMHLGVLVSLLVGKIPNEYILFLRFFKMFICKILILSCFQAIHLKTHPTSQYS